MLEIVLTPKILGPPGLFSLMVNPRLPVFCIHSVLVQCTCKNYFAFLNVVHHPFILSNVCLKKCATPLYLKSIQSRHEVKFQLSQNAKMSLKKFSDLATLSTGIKYNLKRLAQRK